MTYGEALEFIVYISSALQVNDGILRAAKSPITATNCQCARARTTSSSSAPSYIRNPSRQPFCNVFDQRRFHLA
jgi:hypothetical protein